MCGGDGGWIRLAGLHGYIGIRKIKTDSDLDACSMTLTVFPSLRPHRESGVIFPFKT